MSFSFTCSSEPRWVQLNRARLTPSPKLSNATSEAVLSLLLGGCMVATNSYNNLKPISPKPNAIRDLTPVGVKSLRPIFKWHTNSPDQKVDLVIWQAVKKTDQQVKTEIKQRGNGTVPPLYTQGPTVYSKEGIVGGSHQIENDLIPDAVYYWSIKPTGTNKWSTFNNVSTISGGYSTFTDVERGLYFLIRTPRR